MPSLLAPAVSLALSTALDSFADLPSLETLSGRPRLLDGEAQFGPSAWSQRTVARGVWCSDSAQGGPLQRTVRKLLRAWRGPGSGAGNGRPGSPSPASSSSGREGGGAAAAAAAAARDEAIAAGCATGTWKIEAGPVDGLWICRDFLSIEEVTALRQLFSAQNGWTLYNWGSIGRKNDLASVLQRIDFGLPEMTAEGVAAARNTVQPIGELQQQILTLLELRLREAFGEAAWGGPERDGCPPPSIRPNMMQFTRIAPGTCLGNHFDRRDKWDEGIASVAWSDVAGVADPRGDRWTLRMQCGPSGPGQKDLTVEMPAGSAYILCGVAQGRTGVCQRRCVAHENCSCCWTHGIWNEASQHTRQSVTMLVFMKNWGRASGRRGSNPYASEPLPPPPTA